MVHPMNLIHSLDAAIINASGIRALSIDEHHPGPMVLMEYTMHAKHLEEARKILDRIEFITTRINELKERPKLNVSWGIRSIPITFKNDINVIADAVIKVLEVELAQLGRRAAQIGLVLS